MLNKTFNPADAEKRIYAAWEDGGAFKPSETGEKYTIVIPPPNVTGSLHMGHALNNTLQDILCRFERMRGKSVLWQVGTDHAGIATQMVVERQMAERQEAKRTEIGREAFEKKVWEWKEESGGKITQQLRRLGASCDWSRERFTMDEGLSDAVRKVFVHLYNEGLIYRDKRLVNWDPKFETAISDLEVENREVDGHFWHFKYLLADGETYEYVEKDENGNVILRETRNYIAIATTRPETMLGDGAVAVHPTDERYAPIVGKKCHLPLCNRTIPIIVDEYPDPEFGSGAVKITGAHDFNDYMVAKRNNIDMYVLMDTKARMREADYIPAKYRGMDRFEARDAVVADIDAQGLLIQVEDKKIMQPVGDRSGVVIEPTLTDQWYVNAEELAKPAIKAVEAGDTRFVPENWSKTYFQWMRNIEPWCVSRQLWWGHRIPAWYGPKIDENGASVGLEKKIFVSHTEDQALALAAEYYGDAVEITVLADGDRNPGHFISEGSLRRTWIERDPDVLDTWFSSALWPFSTLGWPQDDTLVEQRYPTSTLVTAFDIIFFWVARMMMMGLHFQKQVPFKDVYIHALVLDEKGQKMSKSKGNVIDPLVLIDQYGADALRFTLAAMAAQGRNIRLSEQRIEGYRNFGTKLWNAARFCEMNECKVIDGFEPATVRQTLNQWIIHEAGRCAAEIEVALESYRFNDAAGAAYKFTWNIFCDWGLEFAKPMLQGKDEDAKAETRATIAWALSQTMKLLHPFMPFITEELWAQTADRDGQLINADWPRQSDFPKNKEAAAEMNWVIDLVTAIRSVRAEMNIPAGAKIDMVSIGLSDDIAGRLARNGGLISRLARLETISASDEAPKGSVQVVHEGAIFALPLAGVIDIDAETARLTKEIAKVAGEIESIDKKLANEKFVARAPAQIVEEQKTRRADFEAQLEKLKAAQARLEEL